MLSVSSLAFIVVYTGEDGGQSEKQSFDEEIRRLYRAGSQTAPARFAEQRRIISLPEGKNLNDQQTDDLKRFLTSLPGNTLLHDQLESSL